MATSHVGEDKPSLPPKGYSDKAMNENVTSLTAMYLKCVTASPNTPSPRPSTFSSSAAGSQAYGYAKSFYSRRSQLEKAEHVLRG